MTYLGLTQFPLFVLSTFLLNLTPGPDTAYVMGRSIAQGRNAGLVSGLGISAGCCVHALATALGLSALLAASGTAFVMIKTAGAIYLAYLGVRLILSSRRAGQGASRDSDGMQERPARRYGALFWQGFLTNVLNPKVALFFLFFFPQFVAEGAPHRALAFMTLGAVFVVMSTIWNCSMACVAAGLTDRIQRGGSAKHWIDRLVGAMFIGIAARMAYTLR